jgi:guanylate cyclase, other
VRDCWAEEAAERPRADQLLRRLRSTHSGEANLMDHIFGLLEEHAGRLEEEVEERTRELVEEKKKSDQLLYRMLPK